jgi:hypothetical protein
MYSTRARALPTQNMKAWLFQSVPEHFDLRSGLVEGTRDSWKVSRYRSEIAPGDVVFFWMGGPPESRGLYGWGNITSLPRFDAEDNRFGVDVVYKRRFSRHVPFTKFRDSSNLSKSLILRAPFGTNFAISEEEAKAIVDLLPPGERPVF